MPDKLHGEFRRLIAILLVATIVGMLVVHLTLQLSLLLGMAAYIGWQFYQMYVLDGWLAKSGKQLPKPLQGFWYNVAQHIQTVGLLSHNQKNRVGHLMQQLNRILEAIPDAAVILNIELEVEWYNSSAQRFFGFPALSKESGSVIGFRFEDEDLNQYLKQGDFDNVLEVFSPADPNIELVVRVVSFADEQYLLTAHDISQIKHTHAVRRRFIADASHELRTPLTVIRGYLEMLDEEDFPEDIAHAIRVSQRQAERMQGIVADLLMLSRLEMDEGVELEGETLNVSHMLQELVADAGQLSGERGHQLRLFVDDSLYLKGSENELTSAFGNLIFNAVNHTPDGGVIDVRWETYGDGARLEVADNGPGIDADHVQRLTERFYRVDKGRSRDSGGTGLGLSIVKHVLNHHNASIEIKSVVGSGSRFICIFPSHRVLHQAED